MTPDLFAPADAGPEWRPRERVKLGRMMTGGKVGMEGRRERDWYPTPADVTRAFVRDYPAVRGMHVWEPCCGDGAMARPLGEAGAIVTCSDIHPLMEGAEKRDFFGVREMPAGAEAIITNPPFKLAHAFILHALEMRPRMLALLLKSTFWHAESRRPTLVQHPPTSIHALTWRPDFDGRGCPTVDIIWCVWERDRAGWCTRYLPMERPA